MSGSKILLVDDEPNTLRLVGYTLETEGFDVVTAETGAVALEKVQMMQPDLVILDMTLPDMSGTQVCQHLRNSPETAALPVMMFSARAHTPDKVEALKAGADEYVTKPVDMDELVARVEGMLARSERTSHARQAHKAKVLGFTGAKGGVGTTTVALNVALALVRRKKKVIVAEMRSYLGSVSLHLGLAPSPNLSELLGLKPERIDREQVSRRLLDFPGGLKVLLGPQRVEEFKDIEADHAEAIISSLQHLADYVVIDLACQPSGANRAILRRCDSVVVVLEPESTSVASGKGTMDLLRSWGTTAPRVAVVNHGGVSTSIPPADIRPQLGYEVVGVMPPAADLTTMALKRRAPLVACQPDSMPASTLIKMADRLMNGQVLAV